MPPALALPHAQAPAHVLASSPHLPRARARTRRPRSQGLTGPLRKGGALATSERLRPGDLDTLPVFRAPPVAPTIPDLVPVHPAKLPKEVMPSNAGKRGFPETRWSLVLRAGGEPTADSRKALSELCRSYQGPLRAFARSIEFDPERAEDVLQSFFLRAVEKDVVGAADQARGRFRAFLCSALRHHAINHHRHENRVSSGGGAPHVDVHDVSLESGEPPADLRFDRLWARELMIRVLAKLGEEQTRAGKTALFQALRERLADDDRDRPLRQLAAELQVTEGNLRVKLWRLRSRFIALARAEVAETVERPEDVDAELSTLLAAWSDGQ